MSWILIHLLLIVSSTRIER